MYIFFLNISLCFTVLSFAITIYSYPLSLFHCFDFNKVFKISKSLISVVQFVIPAKIRIHYLNLTTLLHIL